MGNIQPCNFAAPWSTCNATLLCNDNNEIVGYDVNHDDELSGVRVITSPEEERQEIFSAIDQIRSLASEIELAYPAQNLRQMRPFFTNLHVIAEDLPRLDQGLIDLRNQLVSLVTMVQGACFLPTEPEVAADLQIILEAETVLDIIQGFSTNEPRLVAINPPATPPYYINIDPENTALPMFASIDASPEITESAESTARREAELNSEGSSARDFITTFYEGRSPVPGQWPFNFYAAVYHINTDLALPGLDSLISRLSEFATEVANPYRVYICDYTARSITSDSAGLEPTQCDRYIDLVAHRPIFQFIATFMDSYEMYAEILHDSHPEISTNTFMAFLMVNTYEELFWMDATDAWQDTGAASWFNVEQENAYKWQYTRYTEYLNFVFGIGINDPQNGTLIYNAPPWGAAWRLASMQVAIASQGLGPNAVIIGDLLRAGNNNPGLWQDYLPNRERTVASAAAIALHPRESIGAVAFVLNTKLNELGETIFSDPEVRSPDDTYPFIGDPQVAREYFVLSWARYIKAFPEVAVNFPDFFPYGHYSWNIEFLAEYFELIQTVMQQPDSFPELEPVYFPSWGQPIADYFGDLTRPCDSDALILLMRPTS